jgi:hypothetical protein
MWRDNVGVAGELGRSEPRRNWCHCKVSTVFPLRAADFVPSVFQLVASWMAQRSWDLIVLPSPVTPPSAFKCAINGNRLRGTPGFRLGVAMQQPENVE